MLILHNGRYLIVCDDLIILPFTQSKKKLDTLMIGSIIVQ
jgi:hypothetical protein